MIAGLIVAFVVWGVAIFARNQLNDASLASHGHVVDARIVGTAHEVDDDGAHDYLDVVIPVCDCVVRVATDNPAAHPKGSTIGVLYDTTNPTNARPVVDGNSKRTGWIFDVFFFALAGFGLFCAYEFVSPEIAQMRARRKKSSQSITG